MQQTPPDMTGDSSLTPANANIERKANESFALGLTTVSQIAATSSVLALTAIPTLVAASLGVATHFIGYQVSLIYAAGVFFSLLATSMVKRWGAARVGQLALFAAGFGYLGLASGTITGIVLASILIGVGYALNNPSSSHILAKLVPAHRRNLVFSIKQAGVPLGGVLAALAIPPLANTLGWQASLALFALLPLALGLVYQIPRQRWDQDRSPQVKIGRGIIRGQRTVWQIPRLRTLAVLGLLYSAMQLSISTFMVAMLIEEFGWNLLQAAGVAAAVQASGAIGRVFWGMVADKVGSGFLVLAIIGGLTAAAVLWFWTLAPAPIIGVAFIVLSGFTGNGWNGVLLAETAKASPGPGTLTGEVLAYTFLGVMLGPSLFALIYGFFGNFIATYLLFAALCAFGGVMAYLQYRDTTLS